MLGRPHGTLTLRQLLRQLIAIFLCIRSVLPKYIKAEGTGNDFPTFLDYQQVDFTFFSSVSSGVYLKRTKLGLGYFVISPLFLKGKVNTLREYSGL